MTEADLLLLIVAIEELAEGYNSEYGGSSKEGAAVAWALESCPPLFAAYRRAKALTDHLDRPDKEQLWADD